jgi:hypothetical protein
MKNMEYQGVRPLETTSEDLDWAGRKIDTPGHFAAKEQTETNTKTAGTDKGNLDG